MNYPFFQTFHTIYAIFLLVTEQPSQLLSQLLQYLSSCVQIKKKKKNILLYLIMVSKCKISDANTLL